MIAAPMRAPPQSGMPIDQLEDRRAGQQLPGEQHQRREADDDRQRGSNADPVAELQVVAGRVELVGLRQPPQRRRHGERKQQRADPRRTDPPPGADALLIRLARDADRRRRADVRGQHRRHQQRRAERAAADEEIAAAAHEPRRPEPERDDADRIDDEQQEMQVHGERSSARRPCTARCGWRAMLRHDASPAAIDRVLAAIDAAAAEIVEFTADLDPDPHGQPAW